MITIENCRPAILLLPQSKVSLKPGGRVSFPETNSEVERAVKAGWVKVVEPVTPGLPANSSTQNAEGKSGSDASHPAGHDWLVDYSDVENGNVTITDRSSSRSIVAEIAEKKGEQHFTLKNLGTVKLQQYWPTALALEHFDATE